MIKKLHSMAKLTYKATVPYFIRIRTNAEAFGIIRFMEFASKEVNPKEKLLDAGAGSCPYKNLFAHANYESTDFVDPSDKSLRDKHDFLCSLDRIPKEDNSYDVILNTQVLEHMEFPQKVINEFYRILKPGGKLFLTAPQGWGIHLAPYHFFNFTKYGLDSLFKNAGFKILFIRPRGGIFWYLAQRVYILPSYIFFQYLISETNDTTKFNPSPTAFFLFPFYLISLPICQFFLPLLFFYLDWLDKRQDFTLGYACYCIKKP